MLGKAQLNFYSCNDSFVPQVMPPPFLGSATIDLHQCNEVRRTQGQNQLVLDSSPPLQLLCVPALPCPNPSGVIPTCCRKGITVCWLKAPPREMMSVLPIEQDTLEEPWFADSLRAFTKKIEPIFKSDLSTHQKLMTQSYSIRSIFREVLKYFS